MLFHVPVYIAQVKTGHVARPLFFTYPERRDDNLNRLLTKLSRDIVVVLEKLGLETRHDEAARWAFNPRLSTHRVPLTFEMRRRTVKTRYFFVAFRHLGKKIAFTPSVPDVWFEIARGERLETRANEVLQEHWRKCEREADEDETISPEANALSGKAWVQVLDLTARMPSTTPKPKPKLFLELGGSEKPDGATELRKVGRCLDWLYPDELDRAHLREREVDELVRLLAVRTRRPVLLVGSRLVGKTAIVHEAVHRRVAERKSVHQQKRNVWLISPQRLISGMSYVGQWEGRLLAILKHAKKRDHVLYFDDLIGLFLAGLTCQSSLNAATVLKPFLEERTVRVLGEVTPEALRVLQERDRSFADLFHILRVPEPTDLGSQRILIGFQRRIEGKHGCSFDLEVLPAVIDLQRRYDRAAAFPGKAAAVLARLAIRASVTPAEVVEADNKRKPRDPLAERPVISHDAVTADFMARSGLSLAFLDPRQRLDRDEVRNKLREQVVGQSEAVEALADVVSIAKARLNDPDRPLAAFLFLGPTGVGKTESAKAVARTLFGDTDRLVRFDLNEFNQPGAAARLVGTFVQPEGLLTSAVRRQPFAVILLDEVEKADPEVFDLLLQVLGEGRLTDALGRTADFTNTIIILTSNLGVRESSSGLGFRAIEGDPTAFSRAAERFFRPEFFNRLDRVIPFHRLERTEMASIARRLVDEVLGREGFAHRTCVMNVSPSALERVIETGYDPALGARAMKRAVERELTRPAAARLAALATDELTIVTVRAASEMDPGAEGLAVDVRAPGWAAKVVCEDQTDRPFVERLTQARESFRKIQDLITTSRPTGPVIAGKITPEQERYFTLKEYAEEIAETLDRLEEHSEHGRHAYLEARQHEAVGRKARYRAIKQVEYDFRLKFQSIISAIRMEEAVREMLSAAEPVDSDQELFDLDNRLALLNIMATTPATASTYLWIRSQNAAASVASLVKLYVAAWNEKLGLEVKLQRLPGIAEGDALLLVNGIHARAMAETEVGTHLFLPPHGGPVPVRVDVVSEWPPVLADPYAFGPILRVYPEGQAICDGRTGLVAPPPFNADVVRAFTLTTLPRA